MRTFKEGSIETQARDAYARHEVKRIGPAMWRLKRPGSSVFWADIAALGGQRLVIVGDGPDIVFCGGGSSLSPEARVAWVASSSIDYLSTKVYACRPDGEGSRPGREWREEWACADIAAHVEALDGGDCELAGWKRLAKMFFDGRAEMYAAMQDEGIADVGEYSFGTRPSSDVVYAREVCRKLMGWLRA